MAPLSNPRHEKFSQLVASGVKPKEAYISVGYKPTGAKQAASRLLTKVDVRERVSELQETAARSTAESVILNRARVLHRLSQLSHEAQQRGQYSAAARCEELIGKELGMFVERFQKLPTRIEDLPDELLDAFIEQFEQLAADQRAEKEGGRKLLGAGPVIDIQATESSTTAEPAERFERCNQPSIR